jgi:hypothetical protein
MNNNKIKNNLNHLANNYYEAFVKNIDTSNQSFYVMVKQIFGLTTFYLLFIATLFIFLENHLNNNYIFFEIK